jgi:hypothetical protein
VFVAVLVGLLVSVNVAVRVAVGEGVKVGVMVGLHWPETTAQGTTPVLGSVPACSVIKFPL